MYLQLTYFFTSRAPGARGAVGRDELPRLASGRGAVVSLATPSVDPVTMSFKDHREPAFVSY